MKRVRVNIMIPVELIEEIKRIVGPRERSKFIVKATQEKLERLKLEKALKEAASSWSAELHPELETQEDINKWVRELRQENPDRLKGLESDDVSSGH